MIPIQKIQQSIDDQIRYRRKNSLLSHFLTVVRVEMNGLSGTISNDGFQVWTFNYWVGAFHPVIYGTIDIDNNRIKLKSNMNPFGRLLAMLIIGIWAYGILTSVIIQDDNSWTFLWKRILIGLVIICIPIFVFGLAYKFESKKERKRIKNTLQQNV